MVDAAVRRESPALHLHPRMAAAGSAERVELRECAFETKIDLRVDPDSPATPVAGDFLDCGPLPPLGRARGSGDRYVLRCGPDWFLVLDRAAAAAPLSQGLRDIVGRDGSVVDVSAQFTTLELSGVHARDVLAHGCRLDLHPRAFGVDSFAMTNLARARIGLHLAAPTPAFRILVQASVTDYLVRWLLDAMVEYTHVG